MNDPIASSRDSWDNDDLLLGILAGQLLRGRLAVVLGAGASKDFGLPKWDELLKRMYAKKGCNPPANRLPEQAEYFKIEYCGGDDIKLRQAVHDAMYDGMTPNFWTLHPTIAAVGALLMASRRGSASNVITFNFDDILELYLEFHGLLCSSIVSPRQWAEASDVTILHPHGLLPLNHRPTPAHKLVFDRASYSEAMGAKGGEWQELLIGLMRRNLCVLVGISGDDEHMDVMFSDANDGHASKTEGFAFWAVHLTVGSNDVFRKTRAARGIYVVDLADYERDLPAFLFAICQRAAKLRASHP